MKLLPREAWGYAALLILLFCIAAMAVGEFVRFLDDHLPPEVFRLAAAVVGSLTLGFMLIAGAFGLWAIQFSTEAESRRRIGRLVDAMHYIGDGVVAIDRKGRISGSNPSAQAMAIRSAGDSTDLAAQFPCLTPADVKLLAESSAPAEVERSQAAQDGTRELRFRSQPSEGLALVLISDVTSLSAERVRRRQQARLQLIGELARAVAYDVDNLLCGIAGHASLIERLIAPGHEAAQSVRAIQSAARRGVTTSGQLLRLSQSAGPASATDAVVDHVRAALDNLRMVLPQGWTFATDLPDNPGPAGISGTQLEQILVNLGMTLADRATQPGRMVVSCAEPETPAAPRHTAPAELRLQIGVPPPAGPSAPDPSSKPVADLGMLGSIIRSLVEGSGGALEFLVSANGGEWFRLVLPRGRIEAGPDKATLPDEIHAYISRWRVLCAGGRRGTAGLDTQLRRLVSHADRADDIASVLAYLDGNPQTDAVILQERILGQEPAGMLRALIKLRPECAVVVLADQPAEPWEGVAGEVVILPANSSLPAIAIALVDARGMAVRRGR